MKAPADRINTTDDILFANNNLQTPCRELDLARTSDETNV
jgi:hypothetical protein